MLNDAVTRPHALCKKDCKPHGSRFGARGSGSRYHTCVTGFASPSRQLPADEIFAPHRHRGDRHGHGPGRPPWTPSSKRIWLGVTLRLRCCAVRRAGGCPGRRRGHRPHLLCSKYNCVRLLPSSGTSPRKRSRRDVLGLDVTLQPRTPFWGANKTALKKRPQ